MGSLRDVVGVALRCNASRRTMNSVEHYGQSYKIPGRGQPRVRVVMENIDIRRPEIELAAAMGGVRSLLRFAEKTKGTLRPDLEAAIYDGLRETIGEASRVRDLFRKFLNTPDEYQTDERLNAAIATIDLTLHKVKPFFRHWESAPIRPSARLTEQVKVLAEIC